MAVHIRAIGGGVSVGDYIANEVPNGIVNSSNLVFMLNHTPIDGTVIVTLNGLIQKPGIDKDYTISGRTITFTKAPRIDSEVLAHYLKDT